MPKISPAHELARREQILAAAMACFARQGYRATSMDDIVRETGLSVGALYTYYPSKEDLFLALCEQQLQDSMASLNAIFRKPGPMAERSQEAVEYFFGRLADDLVPYARVSFEFWNEAAKSERVQELHTQHLDRVLQFYRWLVKESQAEGAIAPDVDADATAELLMALSEGILLLHVAGVQRVPHEALKAAYVALLDRGLAARPAQLFSAPPRLTSTNGLPKERFS